MIRLTSSPSTALATWTLLVSLVITTASISTSQRTLADAAVTIIYQDDDRLDLQEGHDRTFDDDDSVQPSQAQHTQETSQQQPQSQTTTPIHNDDAVDFRDLFLTPAEAIAVGGTGLEPYGNLFSAYVWPNIESITVPEVINAELIDPFTTNQSGTAGNLDYAELLDVSMLGDRLQVSLSNLRVTNLNTILPKRLFHPTTSPHVLSTEFDMGGKDEEIEMVVRLGIAIEEGSPMAMNNQLDIRFRVPASTFQLDLVVLIDDLSLIQLPLGDILNPGCWMDTLMYTDIPEEELNEALHRAIHLQTFEATLASLVMEVTCVSCDSTMAAFVPRLMDSLLSAANKTTRSANNPNKSIVTTRMEDLAKDAVWNLWELIDLQGVIHEVASFCPSNQRYVEPPANSTVATQLEDFEVTFDVSNVTLSLSRPSFESLIAVGFIGAETAVVAIAQQYVAVAPASFLAFASLAPSPMPTTQPVTLRTATTIFDVLKGNNETEEETNPNLIDWRIVEELETVRSFLVPEDINTLIRGQLDSETEAFTVPVDFTIDTSVGYGVTVDHVSVVGLDTLTKIQLLDPVGAYELQTDIRFEKLYVQANVTITTAPDANGWSPKPEQMSVSMQLYEIAMFIGILLPVDLDLLGQLQLGAILQGLESTLPCLFASAKNSNFEALNVTFGRIENPKVEGYMSSELLSTVNSVSETFFQEFEQDLIVALPTLFQTTIRESLNELILDQYVTANADPAVCTADFTFARGGLVDFRELLLGTTLNSPYGTYFASAYTYARNTWFNQEGVSEINQRIGSLTEGMSGVAGALKWLEERMTSTTSFRVGNLITDVRFDIWNVTLENINSLGMPFSMLFPSEAFVLDNNVSVGAGSKPVTVSANILVKASDGKQMDVHNDFHIRLSVENIVIYAKILLKMAEKALLTFPVKSTNNVNCWLALLPPTRASGMKKALNMSGIAFDGEWGYDNATIDLDCDSCTSPLLPELVASLYETGQNEFDSIEELIRRVINGEATTTFIDNYLEGAPAKCPHSEEYSPEAAVAASEPGAAVADVLENAEDATTRNRTGMFFNIGFASFGAVVLLGWAFLKLGVKCKNDRWKKSLKPEGADLLCKVKDKEHERDEYLDQTMASLYNSLFIPTQTRKLVPVFILLNIALFIVAHTQTSIVLGVDIQLAGDEFTVQKMFEFNFADGLRNTYENGGYEMAIMLFIFGGIWPYFRCLLSLALWFAPPQRLPAAYRGRLLLWIDAMNKLTVRDITKFLIIIAVIFIYVGGPYVFNNKTNDLYAMKIIGVPGPALYCGITAMIISRVTSRWLLDYHLQAMEAAQEAYHLDHVGISIPKKRRRDRSGRRATEKSPENIDRSAVDTFCGDLSDSSDSSGDESDDSWKPGMMDAMDCTNKNHYQKQYEQSVESSEHSDVPLEITVGDERRYTAICGKRMLVGVLGVYVGIFTMVLVLVVGLAIVPKVSLDLSSIIALFLETGTTYDQAINEFGVYSFICTILLQARLLLESRVDYVAIGCLLLVGVIATFFGPLLGFIQWIRNIRNEGWRQIWPLMFEKDEEVLHELPAYLRLYSYKYFSCYVVAYVIGMFQLGTVTIYAIHYFCNALDNVYGGLTFIGIIPETEGECWESQMSHLHNIVVFVACFFYLTFIFIVQLTVQYKWNKRKTSQLLKYQVEESEFFDQASKMWKEMSARPIGAAVLEELKKISKKGSKSSNSDRDDDSVSVAQRSRAQTTSTFSIMTDPDDESSDEEEDAYVSCLPSNKILVPLDEGGPLPDSTSISSFDDELSESTSSGLSSAVATVSTAILGDEIDYAEDNSVHSGSSRTVDGDLNPTDNQMENAAVSGNTTEPGADSSVEDASVLDIIEV